VPGAALGVLRRTELRNNALEKIVDRLTRRHADWRPSIPAALAIFTAIRRALILAQRLSR
jgi:hypothetical protein